LKSTILYLLSPRRSWPEELPSQHDSSLRTDGQSTCVFDTSEKAGSMGPHRSPSPETYSCYYGARGHVPGDVEHIQKRSSSATFHPGSCRALCGTSTTLSSRQARMAASSNQGISNSPSDKLCESNREESCVGPASFQYILMTLRGPLFSATDDDILRSGVNIHTNRPPRLLLLPRRNLLRP
jgi:hypothetical protein